MQYALFGLALAATAYAQGVSEPQFPSGVNGPPPKSNFPKNAFALSTVNVSDAGSATSQQYFNNNPVDCSNIYPKISLTGSALTDQRGSTGSIVANDQFQFDGPPQAGVKVSAGWYRNDNATLALGTAGDAAVFYQCDSGNLVNLYRISIGKQCVPIYLLLNVCSSSTKNGVRYDPVTPEDTTPFKIPKASSDDSIPDGGNGATSQASSASATSSSVAATSAASSSSSAPATTATSSAVVATSVMVAPAPPPMMTQAPVVAPVSNSTAMSTAVVPKASTTAAAPSSSPSPFTNAAPAIAVGQKAIALLAVVAAAFALA